MGSGRGANARHPRPLTGDGPHARHAPDPTPPGRIRWGNVARLRPCSRRSRRRRCCFWAALTAGARVAPAAGPAAAWSRRAGRAPGRRRRPRQVRRRHSERARGRRHDRVRPHGRNAVSRRRRPTGRSRLLPPPLHRAFRPSRAGRIRAGLATRRRRGTKNRRAAWFSPFAPQPTRAPDCPAAGRAHGWSRTAANRRCAASSVGHIPPVCDLPASLRSLVFAVRASAHASARLLLLDVRELVLDPVRRGAGR